MAYDAKKIFSKTFGEYDFGADANEVLQFRLPPGYTGRLVNVGVSVTEEFACDTTVASVKVGTTADDDYYAILNIPDGTADLDFFDVSDDTDAILVDEPIASGSLVKVTFVQATDASADAGKGHVQLDFEVWK